jgi:hypothetical protein
MKKQLLAEVLMGFAILGGFAPCVAAEAARPQQRRRVNRSMRGWADMMRWSR